MTYRNKLLKKQATNVCMGLGFCASVPSDVAEIEKFKVLSVICVGEDGTDFRQL